MLCLTRDVSQAVGLFAGVDILEFRLLNPIACKSEQTETLLQEERRDRHERLYALLASPREGEPRATVRSQSQFQVLHVWSRTIECLTNIATSSRSKRERSAQRFG